MGVRILRTAHFSPQSALDTSSFGMGRQATAHLSQLIGLLSRSLTDTPEVLVLATPRVHERIGVFRRDVCVSMPMESDGLKRGLMGVMDDRLPLWLHAGLRALRREAHLCGSHPFH